MRKYVKNERGVALLWALVTVFTLLVITSSMADLMIKESGISSSIDNSIRSYAAAESGIEKASYCVSKYDTTTNPTRDECLDDLTTDLFVSGTEGPTYTIDWSYAANVYSIGSTGKSGNTSRRIEKTIDVVFLAGQPSFRSYTEGTNPIVTTAPTVITIDGINFNYHWFSAVNPGLSTIDTATDSYIQQYRIKPNSTYGSTSSATAIGMIDTHSTSLVTGWLVKNLSVTLPNCTNPAGFTGAIFYAKDASSNTIICKHQAFPVNADTNYIFKIQFQKYSSLKLTVYEGDNITNTNCKTVIPMDRPANFNPLMTKVGIAGYHDFHSTGIRTNAGNASTSYMGFQVSQ